MRSGRSENKVGGPWQARLVLISYERRCRCLFWYVERHVFTRHVADPAKNLFRKRVSPVPGSVVYCDFVSRDFRHSGIYIGANKIVELSGTGEVRAVTPDDFLRGSMPRKITPLNAPLTASHISISCHSTTVAQRAKSKIGTHVNYDLIGRNCHQFTRACITGDFGGFEHHSFCVFSHVEREAERRLGANIWRVWSR